MLTVSILLYPNFIKNPDLFSYKKNSLEIQGSFSYQLIQIVVQRNVFGGINLSNLEEELRLQHGLFRYQPEHQQL